MKSDVIKIKISDYKRYCNKTDSNDFNDTNIFDEECGLHYYTNSSESNSVSPIGYFRFTVIDERKLFLDKIKYAIEYEIWIIKDLFDMLN